MHRPSKMSWRRFARSIGAIPAGFVVSFVLSYGADSIIMATGRMPSNGTLPLTGSDVLVAGILGYRVLFNILGCFTAAWIAPSRPMQYALILGGLGTAAGIAGALTRSGLAPHWYSWGIVLLALPGAWAGGALRSRSVIVNPEAR